MAQALHLWNEEVPTPHALLARYLPFMERELSAGVPLMQMTRHILGLFQGLTGARKWRQHLSTYAHQKHQGLALVEEAARFVDAHSIVRTAHEPITTTAIS